MRRPRSPLVCGEWPSLLSPISLSMFEIEDLIIATERFRIQCSVFRIECCMFAMRVLNAHDRKAQNSVFMIECSMSVIRGAPVVMAFYVHDRSFDAYNTKVRDNFFFVEMLFLFRIEYSVFVIKRSVYVRGRTFSLL